MTDRVVAPRARLRVPESAAPFVRAITVRALGIDVVLAVVAAVAFVLPLEVQLEQASLLAVLLAAAAIAVRRLSPSGSLLLVVGLAAAQVLGRERPSLVDVAVFVVVGTTAVVGTRVEAALAGVFAFVGGIGATAYLALTGFRYAELITGPPEQALLVGLAPSAALLAVWAVGLALRARSSSEREATLRAEAEDVATRAVDEAEAERIRGAIARDVHDVVGHSLAVIIAQADSVPFLRDEAQIREVSATIAKTARSSLVEVRQVLGQVDGGIGAPDSGSLDEIVARVQEAGVTVDHRKRGTVRPLDADAATIARRVLQEMLTNALRHGAPGAPVSVVETWRTTDVVLEVENAIGHGSTSGSGRGLAGMRARLTAVGGSFEAATIDDTFSARARIPFGAIGAGERGHQA